MTSATDRSHSRDEVRLPRSVARLLDVLEQVVAGGSITLTATANHVGLTPTTALRYLRALEARGYVTRDADGRFSIGPTLGELTAVAGRSDATSRLIASAEPVLERLAEDTGESAYLAVRRGDEAMYVATHESSRAIRHVGWVGRTVPIRGTAVGEALRGLDGPRFKSSTVEPDIAAAAIAVRAGGEPVAALTAIGPAFRFVRARQPAFAAALAVAADQLSNDLDRTARTRTR